MAKRVAYREGDAFAVPLRDGGFGVGVVARANGKGPVLGYFFGPRRDVMPDLDEIADLDAVDNVLVQKFGDLGLIRAKWPVVGALPGCGVSTGRCPRSVDMRS